MAGVLFLQICGHLLDFGQIPLRWVFPKPRKQNPFTLPGIGKRVLWKNRTRRVCNPDTGKPLRIPAKTVVKMRVAKAVKEAIVPEKSSKGSKRKSLRKEVVVRKKPKGKTLWAGFPEHLSKQVFQSPSIGFFCWGSPE